MSTRDAGSFSVTGSTARNVVVYVVDDDDSFCTAITRMLRAAGYEAAGFGSAAEFLMATRSKAIACVLLDVHMPGPSGLELQEALGKTGESPPIIFISGHGSIPTSVRAMKAGAVDFLTKPVKREVLLSAIERALKMATEVRAEQQELRAARQLYETLTPRERQVFDGVVDGKLNKEVADGLGTTERTVKAQRANVMAKMRVTSFADLVRIGCRLQANDARFGRRGPTA